MKNENMLSIKKKLKNESNRKRNLTYMTSYHVK